MSEIEQAKKVIEEEIKENPIILYMKGSKLMPQCGFSARVVQILNRLEIPYVTRNVLEDDNLRQAIKEFSDWPTIPQLYIGGEFIGGCDIIMDLQEQGELEKIVGTVLKSDLSDT
ncbi:MAG: Glutaredoxin 4 [Chlamydiae bacterium]|nr:Glutaredoxin 4 [Chlamydiota bacterium]